MTNNVFKAFFTVIGIALVCILFIISKKLDNNRFQSASTDGVSIIDTRTGRIYIYSRQNKWTMISENGSELRNVEIPSN